MVAPLSDLFRRQDLSRRLFLCSSEPGRARESLGLNLQPLGSLAILAGLRLAEQVFDNMKKGSSNNRRYVYRYFTVYIRV